jgi:hypothetical protein
MEKIALIHLYGQLIWHDEALIIGNRAGLEKLIDALNRALISGKSKAGASTADGEGYDLHIVCQDKDWQSDGWQKLKLPYTDREIREIIKKKNEIDPFSLIGGEYS